VRAYFQPLRHDKYVTLASRLRVPRALPPLPIRGARYAQGQLCLHHNSN
jgi:hypothetical protein